MRISYLYMTSVYTHYDWVVGVVIIVLMCIAALYGFVGYFVIIRKKLYKRVLVGAITVQTMSLIVIIAIAVDPGNFTRVCNFDNNIHLHYRITISGSFSIELFSSRA